MDAYGYPFETSEKKYFYDTNKDKTVSISTKLYDFLRGKTNKDILDEDTRND